MTDQFRPSRDRDVGLSERGDAGGDRTLSDRLAADPENVDARLDEALDETMDASDPIQLTDGGSSGR
ncbi:hypothetical protein ACMGDM_16955 [Sphingomonas sp. DT-51]|uniref:hypothetical protein n=1 Tax=Sphingomonas sp. DT-51 TaxID=3396165 RepID=UPI003F1D40C4